MKVSQEKLLGARARLAQVDRELQAEMAKGSAADPTRIQQLSQERRAVERDSEHFLNDTHVAEANVHDLVAEILFELDPRALVELLDDSVPIFMMPLRVETRFMTVKHIARVDPVRATSIPSPDIRFVGGQWVRIPPVMRVPIAFDRYSALPVIEDSHELWVRAFPDDIALHTHEKPLTQLEIDAGQAFWTHIWYAGPDQSLRIGAWRGLVSGRTPERAAWVARQTRPINATSQPAVTTDPSLPLPVLPDFVAPPLKDSAWTVMPHSKVMPDRLVVRLYQGSSYREVVGKPIPDPLPVSLDPADSVNTIDSSNGDLKLPDKLKWMQDFAAAEQVGMGIRIPLTPNERFIGFSRLIVAGVKTSADSTEGKELIEELIENHHYTKTGFSIVPQGTPTNNTEDAQAGHTEDTSDDDSLFQLELGDDQFSPSTDPEKIKDGQYLADALGIDYDVLQHTRNAGIADIKEAMCMNTALWPTTLGYYLRHLLHPILTESEISRVKYQFNRFVLGRGRIPAIRVGSQPYGILATTAYSKLEYQTTGNAEDLLLSKLHKKILAPMDMVWSNLAQQVVHASTPVAPSQKNKQFLDIIGLHPASVEFYQRFVSGNYFLWNLYNYNRFLHGATAPANVSYATSLQFSLAFGSIGLSSIHAPRLFDFTYVKEHKYLNGPVIDRLKLSETRRIEDLGSNNENYIDWLIMSNWEQIRAEDFSNIGVAGATPPKALLYLMLRHSCLLEYVRTSLIYLLNNNYISANALLDHELVNYTLQTTLTPEVQTLFKSNIFMQEGLTFEQSLDQQVTDEFIARANSGVLNGITLRQLEDLKTDHRTVLKSNQERDFLRTVDNIFDQEVGRLQIPSTKVGLITETYPFMTAGDSLHAFVHDRLWNSNAQEVAEMQELIKAMTCLKDLPTARLERTFAEHIDLVSYRLDAWFTSLASQRLAKQRMDKTNRKTGLYVGAYGWLENVQPNLNYPGIHYEEVDVQPTAISVPGFSHVNAQAVSNYNLNVVATDIWGQIDPAAVGRLVNPVIGRDPVNALVFNREVPLPAVYEEYTFLARPDPEFTGVSYANHKALNVLTAMEEVAVDQPFALTEAMVLDTSPKVTYLGTSGIGDITYDQIKNRFIHVPRIDPDNLGYVHAPSINHATTAAVLRAGYESHKGNPGSPDNAMAVNLSSARVRRSLFYLEGLKNGQELGALLGYQFERGLHDKNMNLDRFIFEFRLKFPLVAGRVTNGAGSSIQTAESYNVVNGMALITASSTTPFPYGVTFPTSVPNPAEQAAIIAEVQKLHDALDGINDLLMAESMYQVVQGNHPRAASSLNALAGKGVPTDPQVIQTPRSFHIMTHRTGIQFDLTPGGHARWTANGTPRSIAEPALNRWLESVLPAANQIAFNYGYRFVAFDGEPGTLYGGTATAANLGIEPIDLYAMLSQPAEQGDGIELVQRIAWYVQATVLSAANVQVEIAFEDRTGLTSSKVTLNELHPLMAQLKTTVGDSRAINAKDLLLASGADATIAANPGAGVNIAAVAARLADAKGVTMSNGKRGLGGLLLDLASESSALQVLMDSPMGGLAGITDFAALSAALLQAAAFGVGNVIPVITGTSLEATATAMIAQAGRALAELQARNTEATAQLAIANNLTTQVDVRINALVKAAQAMYGRNFRIFPEYMPYDTTQFNAAVTYPDFLAYCGLEAVEEWLQGVSPVRKRVHGWHTVGLLSQALRGNDGLLDLTVVQLPLLPLDGGGSPEVRWLGVEFPDGYAIPDEVLSIVFQLPTAFTPSGLQAGILIDEWTEEIPEKMAHTGIAVHYNNPDSEPAQTCLLAISPNETGYWSWDDLMDTINETFDWAKKRAVDPDMLNTTLFSQVLPATYAAISGTDDSPTLDYGRNIIKVPKHGVFDMIKLKDFTA